MVNVDASVKNMIYKKKNKIDWNQSTCSCENGKYLASIMDDSGIICDEVVDADTKVSPKHDNDKTKTIAANFNEQKATCKTQSFCLLLAVLLIIIALLIAVTIYRYLKKYQAKQLLLFTDIGIRKYDFFNDIINIEKFDSNNIKIDEKSCKGFRLYYFGHVKIKEHIKIYNVNPLYLIFRNINEYFQEIDKIKYLKLQSVS